MNSNYNYKLHLPPKIYELFSSKVNENPKIKWLNIIIYETTLNKVYIQFAKATYICHASNFLSSKPIGMEIMSTHKTDC